MHPEIEHTPQEPITFTDVEEAVGLLVECFMHMDYEGLSSLLLDDADIAEVISSFCGFWEEQGYAWPPAPPDDEEWMAQFKSEVQRRSMVKIQEQENWYGDW